MRVCICRHVVVCPRQIERAFKRVACSVDGGGSPGLCTRVALGKWIGDLSNAAFARTQELAKQVAPGALHPPAIRVTPCANMWQKPLVAWAAGLQQMWLAVCEPEDLRVTPDDLPPTKEIELHPPR